MDKACCLLRKSPNEAAIIPSKARVVSNPGCPWAAPAAPVNGLFPPASRPCPRAIFLPFKPQAVSGAMMIRPGLIYDEDIEF